jgi:hypothetical protein
MAWGTAFTLKRFSLFLFYKAMKLRPIFVMSRFSYIFIFIVAAFLWGCKGSTTGPGNTNPTATPESVGDTIPRKLSIYNFEKSQMNTMDSIDPATIQIVFAQVDSAGMSFQGKNPVYFINDDEQDSTYLYYETNGDVSIYFQHPGYYQIFHNPSAAINEPLQQIADFVFHQWIRFPIGAKDTSSQTIYNSRQTIYLNGGATVLTADIHAVARYVSDSTIQVSSKSLSAKYCRVSISANINAGQPVILSNTRDFLFVPNIGYFASFISRTLMNQYTIQLIPQDTTRRQRILTSYHLQ